MNKSIDSKIDELYYLITHYVQQQDGVKTLHSDEPVSTQYLHSIYAAPPGTHRYIYTPSRQLLAIRRVRRSRRSQ